MKRDAKNQIFGCGPNGRLVLVAIALLLGSFHVRGQPQPGTLLWSIDVGPTIVSSPAQASDGTIYIAAGTGLFAITNTGSAASNKWTFSSGDVLRGSAAVASDGTVYFGGAGNFYAVTPDGSQKWKLPLTNAIYDSTPALGADGTVYFVASGRLYAVTAAGAVRWQHVIDDTNSTPARNLSPAIGSDRTVYVGGYYNNTLYAINPDGSEKWAFAGGTGESPAIGADGTIYISLGRVHALAPNGVELWQGPPEVQANAPAIVGRDGTIYIGNTDLGLYALKPTGETDWQAVPFSIRALPTTAAVDSSGTIYYCVSNCVFALNSQGAVEWAFASSYQPPLPNYVTYTSPAIGPDGTIYAAFGSTLYAISGTNKLADSPWPMHRQNPRHTGKVEKPALKEPKKRSDAGFEFQLYPHELGLAYTIEASTNLNTWTALTNFIATTLPMPVVDFSASNSPMRFYRARTP